MLNYNDGNWRGWNGEGKHKCPVHPKSLCAFMSKDGGYSESEADHVIWESFVGAWCVLKAAREPRGGWVRPECIKHDAPDDCDAHRYIHVREVLE